MEIGPVHVGPGDSLAALIRMHRADRVHESPSEQRHPVAADVGASKLRRAQNLAADLRRTINRQRNELGRLRSIERRTPAPVRQPAHETPAGPAPVTYDRKSYAPDAIGKVSPRAAAPAPAPAAPAVEAAPMVSNLGTLVDVLA